MFLKMDKKIKCPARDGMCAAMLKLMTERDELQSELVKLLAKEMAAQMPPKQRRRGASSPRRGGII